MPQELIKTFDNEYSLIGMTGTSSISKRISTPPANA